MRLVRVVAAFALFIMPSTMEGQGHDNVDHHHRHFHELPEPSALILLITAAAGVMLVSRSRIKRL